MPRERESSSPRGAPMAYTSSPIETLRATPRGTGFAAGGMESSSTKRTQRSRVSFCAVSLAAIRYVSRLRASAAWRTTISVAPETTWQFVTTSFVPTTTPLPCATSAPLAFMAKTTTMPPDTSAKTSFADLVYAVVETTVPTAAKRAMIRYRYIGRQLGYFDNQKHNHAARMALYQSAEPIWWRRGWDSNPRYAHAYNGFRDRPVRPLRHPSAGGMPSPAGFARPLSTPGRPPRQLRLPPRSARSRQNPRCRARGAPSRR